MIRRFSDLGENSIDLRIVFTESKNLYVCVFKLQSGFKIKIFKYIPIPF